MRKGSPATGMKVDYIDEIQSFTMASHNHTVHTALTGYSIENGALVC